MQAWLIDPRHKTVETTELHEADLRKFRRYYQKSATGLVCETRHRDAVFRMLLESVPMARFYPSAAHVLGCKGVSDEKVGDYTLFVGEMRDSRQGPGFHLAGCKRRFLGRAVVVGNLDTDDITWIDNVDLDDEPDWTVLVVTETVDGATRIKETHDSYKKECYTCKKHGVKLGFMSPFRPTRVA